jgi:hypothetical protein
MLAARTKKMESTRLDNPSLEDGQILSKLVCYTSKLVCRYFHINTLYSNLFISIGSFMCRKSWFDCYGKGSSISN